MFTKRKPVVVIIGAGGAAMTAAIEAAQAGADVKIVTKAVYRQNTYTWGSEGGCTWKTHGFNAAVDPTDSVENHIFDTLSGGVYAANPELVSVLCHGAIELVSWLESLGVPFSKSNSEFLARPFGGCDKPRSVFFEDRLGFFIQKALIEKIKEYRKSIKIFEGYRVIDLVKDDHDTVIGVKALQIHTLEHMFIPAESVVIADGGGASMYLPTAASMDKTSDGIAMALRAGAKVIDLEFVQFHPTGIATHIPVFDGALVEEALRYDGARLLNKYGEQFMFNYSPTGEKSTRDIVSRGIYSEIMQKRCFDNNAVNLDIGHCKHLIKDKYPALYERLTQAGFSPDVVSNIYVRPTAHYLMGGVHINERTQTTLKGVFCAGESAGGIHGANRLGGNGLSEALVFGRIAGRNAAQHALGTTISPDIYEDPIKFSSYTKTEDGFYSPDTLLNRLGNDMYWHMGPIRSEASILEMQKIIEEITDLSFRVDVGRGARASGQIQTYISLMNLLLVSKIICNAALLRKETRGAHYRADYQDTDKVYRARVYHLLHCGKIKEELLPAWGT